MQNPDQPIAGLPDPKTSGELENDSEKKSGSIIMFPIRAVLGWMTPYEQVVYLRQKRDLDAWERFRDSLMRRWSNLNVICGLIMGAVSTIVFANFPLSRASFTLGIISLLSSLIAIGFGVGLIYVLGDVRGSSLLMIDQRYPGLYLFALSIPEVWAFISFGTFFAGVGVIVWQSPDKGWIVKAGVTAATVALVAHLVAFGFLFREQDTTEYLIPDGEVIISDTPLDGIRESKQVDKGKAPMASLDERPRTQAPRPGMSATPLHSSQTLVASPASQLFRAPMRANTVQASPGVFVLKPEGEIATVNR